MGSCYSPFLSLPQFVVTAIYIYNYIAPASEVVLVDVSTACLLNHCLGSISGCTAM